MVENININIPTLKEKKRSKKSYSLYLDEGNVEEVKKRFSLPLSSVVDKIFESIVESVKAADKQKQEIKLKEKAGDEAKKE